VGSRSGGVSCGWCAAVGAAAALACRPAPAPTPEALARAALAPVEGVVAVAGLRDTVEVLRDPWGVPHIYARSVEDLFFAQGFVAAQDRLWQMEMWRRAAEGRLAEVAGPAAVERDRLARLLRYRGDPEAEWASYHPDARRIVGAFVRGVNAYMAHVRPRWPVEFVLTGLAPEPWTPEVPLLRMPGWAVTTNAADEVELALAVARWGPEEANRRAAPEPFRPLRVPAGLDVRVVPPALLEILHAGNALPPAPPVLERYRDWVGPPPDAGAGGAGDAGGASNAWVVAGRYTASGAPLLANDPHRAFLVPSLRYVVHLVGPGWNVIGAGEPALPGVAIGHNERVAWGITLAFIDQQDVYVEELNPANPREVRWRDGWEALRVEVDTIGVRGEAPRVVELAWSRHGPILFADTARNLAYALRSVFSEPGTASYLGALALNVARDARDAMRAAAAWNVPPENLVFADVDGNIAWQVAGLAPVRDGWDGRLPVPGRGTHEWAGFLPLERLPREWNPRRGFIATANQNILPEGYRPILGFEWEPPYRYRRIAEVLTAQIRSGRPFTVEDMQALQHDVVSAPALEAVRILRGRRARTEAAERVRQMLLAWDGRLARESGAAAAYKAWRAALDPRALEPGTPRRLRDSLAHAALDAAVARLQREQGPRPAAWRWGRMNRQPIPHPLGIRAYHLPTIEMEGDGTTVNAFYGARWGGASYRQILDLADWDRSVATQMPGQSGQPGHPHYADLLPLWVERRYFPLLFSREAVTANAAHRLLLVPAPER
jgi:penicillin amidase